MNETLFDVVAVNIETNRIRLIAVSKEEGDADAIVEMAVMRRGVDEEFFSTVPASKYSDGDFWK